MTKQQVVRKEHDENTHDGNQRPASLLALEEQFTKEQLDVLRRVALALAASALKIARENGMRP